MNCERKVVKRTCVVCPMGCELEIEVIEDTCEKKKVIQIKGNMCPRGDEYGRKEIINPERILTTSVLVENGEMPLTSVRTSAPISLYDIPKAMKIIKGLKIKAPVKVGDIIYKDFIKKGVNLVATRSVKEKS